MILVDASALVPFLAGETSHAVDKLGRFIKSGAPFGLAPPTIQQVLETAQTEKDFSQLRRYLCSQRIYAPKGRVGSYVAAAKLRHDCRRKGVAEPNSIQALVAQIAMEHDLMLLHDDPAYEAMARVVGLVCA